MTTLASWSRSSVPSALPVRPAQVGDIYCRNLKMKSNCKNSLETTYNPNSQTQEPLTFWYLLLSFSTQETHRQHTLFCHIKCGPPTPRLRLYPPVLFLIHLTGPRPCLGSWEGSCGGCLQWLEDSQRWDGRPRNASHPTWDQNRASRRYCGILKHVG